jgi:hypothetical protein
LHAATWVKTPIFEFVTKSWSSLHPLTAQDIKDQLTQQGHEEAVFALQSRKPAPKKVGTME